MTLQHFRVLAHHSQYRNLLVNGVCVAERISGNCQILLFQLNDWYVEVFFNDTEEEVLYTRSFKNTDELAPYLNCNEINNVLKELL